jgi:hypothetical protein
MMIADGIDDGEWSLGWLIGEEEGENRVRLKWIHVHVITRPTINDFQKAPL